MTYYLLKRLANFELDYANYSSGVLEDDSGFIVRRFRLGLAGQWRSFPSVNYKIEIDLTDGENTLSDAYLSWLCEVSPYGTN